jgi:hypothetical protein
MAEEMNIVRPGKKEKWILWVLQWPERFNTEELEEALEIVPNAPNLEFLKTYVADRKRREEPQ